MFARLRSQKANNFQAVIALFLIGSGSAKREMEVLAHAGLSLSYVAAIRYLNQLSREATRKYQELIKQCMMMIVWDNLNIAFRVAAQRHDSKDHFDNGTTSTVLPIWDPINCSTRTPYGTLPLDMKPPRTTTDPTFQWSAMQLKHLAMEHIGGLEHLKSSFEACPTVDPIAVHVTEQYPLPALHEEESSIEGTITVYVSILRNLGMTNEDLKAHGLLFNDGDLLTDSLVEKLEGARRNSTQPIEGMQASVRRFGLFHGKMAGCRLTVNEHWGKPNSKHPGSGLWWENNRLGRKNMVAGWQASKATPWKPAHELLQISLAAHVKDAYRVSCGEALLADWAQSATMEEFDHVSNEVYQNLFSTKAYDEFTRKPYRDTTIENAILFNRDGLLYIELVHAVRTGDIGRVVNVLKMWMIMMRTKKTMPKYADAIFETLGRVTTYPEKLRKFFLHNWLVNVTGRPNCFKEVDLLQEHQNFWAKTIYNAKESNRSWNWLAMVTVCIFELRNAMHTVQHAFNISSLGTKHTIPDMTQDINILATALEENKIQVYIMNRPSNEFIDPVRDLLDHRIPVNLGFVEPTVGDGASGEPEEEGELYQEEYETSREDLAVDEEEEYDKMDDAFENMVTFMSSNGMDAV
ncbi:hypothetical protein HHX47_DHR5001104 [Lentinula edodes]|nr:hypothetical protein HHX47_DHR5001104 [Lentinula edodes]